MKDNKKLWSLTDKVDELLCRMYYFPGMAITIQDGLCIHDEIQLKDII